jgi:hypothetical protein
MMLDLFTNYLLGQYSQRSQCINESVIAVFWKKEIGAANILRQQNF